MIFLFYFLQKNQVSSIHGKSLSTIVIASRHRHYCLLLFIFYAYIPQSKA